jgi:hypothetical protein
LFSLHIRSGTAVISSWKSVGLGPMIGRVRAQLASQSSAPAPVAPAVPPGPVVLAPPLSNADIFRAAVEQAGFTSFEAHEVTHPLVIGNYDDLVAFNISNPAMLDMIKAMKVSADEFAAVLRDVAQQMFPQLPFELPFVSIVGICRK